MSRYHIECGSIYGINRRGNNFINSSYINHFRIRFIFHYNTFFKLPSPSNNFIYFYMFLLALAIA